MDGGKKEWEYEAQSICHQRLQVPSSLSPTLCHVCPPSPYPWNKFEANLKCYLYHK